MRKKLFAFILCSLALCCMHVQGKERCTPIYIFGTSASFIDSVVYITEIQIVDSAWVADKTGFLVKRGNYSSQLSNYLAQQGMTSRTCFVTYATNEKDILKKMAKMRKKLNGSKKHPKHFDIRLIDEEEFKFHAEPSDNIQEQELVIDEKAVKRAEKSKKKKKTGKLESTRKGNNNDNDLPPTVPPRH
ncbi:MAG: hypothetical protein J5548_14915 [Prevotella sp.]|nr:hypothetical protein [Prevotella sp.]